MHPQFKIPNEDPACIIKFKPTYCTIPMSYIKASQRALDYFADVEPTICRQIHNLYAPDFDLFHYSLEGFP